MLALAAVLILPAAAGAADLYVNPTHAGCSDTAGSDVARNAATPWCSPTPAMGLARPGDTVHLASTTYHSQLRPLSSGTASQPIVYLADGPVTILAPAGTISVMLTGVHDVGAARLHGACRGAAGDLGGRRERASSSTAPRSPTTAASACRSSAART